MVRPTAITCYIAITLFVIFVTLQAAKLRKAGWTLVDVRLASDFDNMSAEGSINVPMFRYV
jgi:rhodanese-related sulfurtransferase